MNTVSLRYFLIMAPVNLEPDGAASIPSCDVAVGRFRHVDIDDLKIDVTCCNYFILLGSKEITDTRVVYSPVSLEANG